MPCFFLLLRFDQTLAFSNTCLKFQGKKITVDNKKNKTIQTLYDKDLFPLLEWNSFNFCFLEGRTVEGHLSLGSRQEDFIAIHGEFCLHHYVTSIKMCIFILSNLNYILK